MSARRAVPLLLLAAACTGTASPPAPPAARSNAAAPAPGRATPPPAMPTLEATPQSARVRPRPAPCLPTGDGATPTALAARAQEELDAGALERALACADEALRLAPRHIGALVARADALAGLGRHDEARVAYALALAVDPDDAFALLGAAELYVRRLDSDYEGISLGLEYAKRGLRAAARRVPRDAALVARLELVAGMAENDLGRSRLALAHLERSLLEAPDDPDAIFEKGVALYELCRFGEARRTLERALTLAPDDPWILHQLGLVLERTGESGRAETLFARARALAPADFRPEVPVDRDAFVAEVRSAVAALPEEERRALARVPIEVTDLPDTADLLAVEPPLSPSILGLFRGPPENEPCTAADGPQCRSIVLYRRNLVRFARDRRELADQVRVTLLHELGHLHGESDDELRARGLD